MTNDWENIKKGNQKALQNLYESHIDLLYDYGRKFTQDHQLIEDAIQEIFISIWNNRKNISQPSSSKAYLLSSLRRKIGRKRNQKYTTQTLLTEENQIFDAHFYFEPTNEDQGIAQQMTQIKKHIDQLSERQKEILYLKFFEGMDYEEIGQIMDLKYQSVRNLYSRAIAALKNHISVIILILLIQLSTNEIFTTL